MKKVIVIGGGASGMMAAAAAARHGANVLLMEHMPKTGKKLLSTGNGKCNYTNREQGLRCYRGEDPAFVLPVFSQFSFAQTVAFFREIGIVPKERGGYFYPASEQASSVADALSMELRRLFVSVMTECAILSAEKRKGRFFIRCSKGEWEADCCIFACGGKSFPKSGSDGSAYPVIEAFGHSFTELAPALVYMKAKQSFFRQLAGIRADASVRLEVDGKSVCGDRGQLQLTADGISGIPAFQISRFAAFALRQHRKVRAVLDFAPDLTKEELMEELLRRFLRQDEKTCEEALIGFFPKKLACVLLRESGINPRGCSGGIAREYMFRLSDQIKGMTIDIIATGGFDKAQVMAGGVDTSEIFAHTLESRLIPGLFFAGEVIDIDGMCGGYNLQWAWSSGYVAGMHAAGEKEG